jgi:tetratricopeptide (TPR) repeat protein
LQLGEHDRSTTLAGEELELARQTNDQAGISKAFARLGAIALASGKAEQASTYFTESYTMANRAGDEDAQSLALLNLGEIARTRGDFTRACELLEASLAHVRANDMTWGIANILTLLGHLDRQQQQYARAKVRYRESLALYRRLGNATYTAWCLEGIAAVAGAEQRYAHVTKLLATAAALRQAAQTPLPPTEQEAVDKLVMTARAVLDERAFREEWRSGSTMTQDAAIADALMGLAT